MFGINTLIKILITFFCMSASALEMQLQESILTSKQEIFLPSSFGPKLVQVNAPIVSNISRLDIDAETANKLIQDPATGNWFKFLISPQKGEGWGIIRKAMEKQTPSFTEKNANYFISRFDAVVRCGQDDFRPLPLGWVYFGKKRTSPKDCTVFCSSIGAKGCFTFKDYQEFYKAKYNQDLTQEVFAAKLSNHTAALKGIIPEAVAQDIETKLKHPTNDRIFDENFHHSERWLECMLSDNPGIVLDMLKDAVKDEIIDLKKFEIMGIMAHEFTTRKKCNLCTWGGRGVITLIKPTIVKDLSEAGFEVSKNFWIQEAPRYFKDCKERCSKKVLQNNKIPFGDFSQLDKSLQVWHRSDSMELAKVEIVKVEKTTFPKKRQGQGEAKSKDNVPPSPTKKQKKTILVIKSKAEPRMLNFEGI